MLCSLIGRLLSKSEGSNSPTSETFILIALHGPRKTSTESVPYIVVMIPGHSHHDHSGCSYGWLCCFHPQDIVLQSIQNYIFRHSVWLQDALIRNYSFRHSSWSNKVIRNYSFRHSYWSNVVIRNYSFRHSYWSNAPFWRACLRPVVMPNRTHLWAFAFWTVEFNCVRCMLNNFCLLCTVSWFVISIDREGQESPVISLVVPSKLDSSKVAVAFICLCQTNDFVIMGTTPI